MAANESKTENPTNQLKTISPQKIEYINGPQYSSFYSNNVGFNINVLDFALIFGEIIDADQERAIVERRARITMTPTQAKVFAMLLVQNVQHYEELNGVIPVPDNGTKMVPSA